MLVLNDTLHRKPKNCQQKFQGQKARKDMAGRVLTTGQDSNNRKTEAKGLTAWYNHTPYPSGPAVLRWAPHTEREKMQRDREVGYPEGRECRHRHNFKPDSHIKRNGIK